MIPQYTDFFLSSCSDRSEHLRNTNIIELYKYYFYFSFLTIKSPFCYSSNISLGYTIR